MISLCDSTQGIGPPCRIWVEEGWEGSKLDQNCLCMNLGLCHNSYSVKIFIGGPKMILRQLYSFIVLCSMWPSNNLHFLISTIPCLLFGVLGLRTEHSQLGLQKYSLHPTEFPTKTANNRINVLHEKRIRVTISIIGQKFSREEGSNFLQDTF